jgi:hypothetical protein
LSGSAQVSAAWDAFKDICEISVERTLEGAQLQFAQVLFGPPQGQFQLTLTRYWYEHGDVSDTPYLAQITGKYAFDRELLPLTVMVEVNSNALDPAVDLTTLRRFIDDVERMEGLWSALEARRPVGLEFYAGPQ